MNLPEPTQSASGQPEPAPVHPARLPLIYFAVVSLLVAVVDHVIAEANQASTRQELARLATDIAFVAVTAGVIYWVRLVDLRRRSRSEFNRQLFEQLVTHSREAAFVVDPAEGFRFTYVNSAAASQLGHSREHLLGRSVWEISPELTRARCDEGWATLQSDQLPPVRAHFKRSDGSEILAEISLEVLAAGNRRLLGGRARDITLEAEEQRRQAELLRELTESQNRLALATGAARLGVWDYDVTAGVVMWDAQLTGSAGLPGRADAVPFAAWMEMVLPGDRDRLAESLAETLAGAAQVDDEFRVSRADGKVAHLRVLARILRDERQQAVRAVGVTYDVTQLREGERRLREQESFIESILNASRDGVMVFRARRDPRGVLTELTWLLINPAGERLLGRGWDQVVGRSLVNELPGHVSAGIWSRYVEVVETGRTDEFIHHFDADRIHAWIQVLAVKLGDGLMVEWRDVSLEWEQQQQVERSRNELDLFNRLSLPFLTATEPRALFGQLQTTLAAAFGASSAVVGLIDSDGTLELPAVTDPAVATRWPRGEWEADWAEPGEPGPARWDAVRPFPGAAEPVAGQLAAPIALGEEMLGRIWLKPGRTTFAEPAGEQLERICRHLAAPFRSYLAERRFNAQRERALGLARENEAKFAAVFDHSLDALLLVDTQSGLIADCNAQAVKLFAADTRARLIGIEARLLARNPRSAQEADELRRQIAAGTALEGEFEYRSFAGTTFWGHIACRQMQLSGANLQLFRITDISQRKTAEQYQAAQSNFRQQLIDSVPLPIFVKDTEGRYLECNRALAEFLGVSREDLLGKSVADVFPAPSASEYRRRDEELFLHQGQQIYRGRVPNAQGEDRAVVFHRATFRRPDGSLGGLIGTFIDVTEFEAASERLRLQETALNAAASGLVITDRAGMILWANPAFCQLSGYSAEELAEKGTHILKSGQQDEEFYRNLWQTVLSGQVWRGELINQRKDGTLYHEEMTITPVKGDDGTVANFVAIKQDISGRKELEQQYLRAQRMEGIGLLASGIAHDLNNVLAPVLLSIELLRSMHSDNDTTEILHTVEMSARRGADIVRQVLTFARGVKGERIPLQSKHLVKDIVRVAKETFPKDIEVHIRSDAEVANIEGDPTQIHQVLLNLAVNGRDAMPEGGRLTLGAHNRVVETELEAINGRIPPGAYVMLSVADTGTGIAPENVGRLFEPFYSTKDASKGTGLGLPTALGIVKSHNGYFRVVSSLGKGSEFQVYLPLCSRDELPAPTRPPAAPRGKGESVLVVDDEPGIRSITSEILSRHGYRVLIASDGTEAMALVAQHRGRIDLVLTDVMMPFMDGVALVRSLRKLAPNTRVLAFSGLSNDASLAPKVEELRRMGLPPVLSKPLATQDLLTAIHELISSPPPD